MNLDKSRADSVLREERVQLASQKDAARELGPFNPPKPTNIDQNGCQDDSLYYSYGPVVFSRATFLRLWTSVTGRAQLVGT